MNSLGQFIVKPFNDRYNNKIKVGDKDLITNTQIEDWSYCCFSTFCCENRYKTR